MSSYGVNVLEAQNGSWRLPMMRTAVERPWLTSSSLSEPFSMASIGLQTDLKPSESQGLIAIPASLPTRSTSAIRREAAAANATRRLQQGRAANERQGPVGFT